ncbi:hypothetical protein B0T26DRAFT_739331 [Lasiosphaeria miniovina]|uniref:Kelch repeat-containing protein n=1 Tax=Lasiosphaeria miniovina TaxID=1954250 RepID=A0AA40AU33_9PEZI|nr:uncharacterized protein B0T26DRAFT_739331 [Lasiosphaeria miniovina]KAK0722006.1 hypothetical protein B0T26DRAFT_739331 [Lasiosphaeria miniovina]
MTFVSIPKSTPSQPTRPKFHHQYTNDRIREGSGRPPSFSMMGKIRKDRKSIFKELGLETDEPMTTSPSEKEFGEITGLPSPITPGTPGPPRTPDLSRDGGSEDGRRENGNPSEDGRWQAEAETEIESPSTPTSESSQKPWYTKLSPGRRPRVRTASSAPPTSFSTISRISTIALLIAVVIPGFSYYNGDQKVSPNGADAGVIYNRPRGFGPVLEPRGDSPTKVCKRWGQQSAHLNGTLYLYGGQVKTTEDQTIDTWNSDFLAIDLTKSWDISSPAIRGLPQPSGPPAVSLGYLWNDYNSLYLYGGEFADNPFVEPAPVSTWRYSIADAKWIEYTSPKTSAGNSSDGGGQPVQRAAEGAGISVPELGLSFYFGGHLDLSTTPGWSNQIARVYLKSLLEFTHPGFTNNGVYSLASGSGAGEDGVYRNITEGGLQTDSGFSERADGVLVFVPGWGDLGVLIGLAGGTADTFTNDLSTLDVYDIASSKWYHQQTTGTPPEVRVNPCAVIASAPDASSFQIFLYGGQNLQPYKEQIQYSDMFILSIPSFTWIKVDQSGNNMPAARAGHSCQLRDGQVVVVGGYIGTSPACESPGIYVFNASSLAWESKFTALSHSGDLDPENSVLGNSYGYQVPAVVASVIGGGSTGGATATTPAAGPATGGPFATGKSPVFTVTASGSTATVTQWEPGATATRGPSGGGSSTGGGGEGGSNVDGGSGMSDNRRASLIAAGIIAALAGLAAVYLGYCAWLYRRQVRAYKSHLAVANRYSPAAASASGLSGGLAAFFGRKGSKKSTMSGNNGDGVFTGAAIGASSRHDDDDDYIDEKQLPRGRSGYHWRDLSSASTADSIGFYGGIPPTEPKMLFDDQPTPESGVSGHTSSAAAVSSSRHTRHSFDPAYPVRPTAWWPGAGGDGVRGSSSGTGTTPASGSGLGGVAGTAAVRGRQPRRSMSASGGSTSSTEQLIDGQEPSFFSVVLSPRRALRVVNGLENEHDGAGNQ